MEEVQIDHRGKYKGLLKEVREALQESGCFISEAAVTKRVRRGRDKKTMRIYKAKLRSWARAAEKEAQRQERQREEVRSLINSNEYGNDK